MGQVKCSGEPGLYEIHQGEGVRPLEFCPGCSVCHGNCGKCDGTGKVFSRMVLDDVLGRAEIKKPCTNYQPAKGGAK